MKLSAHISEASGDLLDNLIQMMSQLIESNPTLEIMTLIRGSFIF
jgi:hypothetical protein